MLLSAGISAKRAARRAKTRLRSIQRRRAERCGKREQQVALAAHVKGQRRAKQRTGPRLRRALHRSEEGQHDKPITHGQKAAPEDAEEKAARKQAEAARFGQGGQIESWSRRRAARARACGCARRSAAIVGEIPEFFEKDEERLARPVRAQLPAWDPKDKTRRMLDDYSEIVSELRAEEINQDRANTLRVAGHVQKLIKGPGPPSVRKVDLIKRHARGEGLTVPVPVREEAGGLEKDRGERFKLKELGRRITAEANDPRPSRDEVGIGAEVVILSRLGSRAKALAAKRLKKAKRKGLEAMVLSELVYCSHLVGFNDFQMDNPLKIVSADLYWAGDRTARDKAELIKAGITHIVNCSPNIPNRFPRQLNLLPRPRVTAGRKARQNILYEEYCMAAAFIKDALELGGRVLVTCATGYDSSACALLGAYLIRVRKCPSRLRINC